VQFEIKTAKKSEAKARIAICGPSGSGKTFSALELAKGLCSPEEIVLIDTENRSAAKYADGCWRHLILPDFRLETYVHAIEYAQNHATVLVVDSISHAWAGKGGALELADTQQKKVRNKMEAWRHVTPLHNRFVEAMVNCSCHLIVTMRTKTEWVFEQDARGRNVPRKIGTKPIQRDGIEYEFDIVCDMTQEHDLIVTKTRCPEIDGAVVNRPGRDFGQTIGAWLSDQPPREKEPRLVIEASTPAERQSGTLAGKRALDELVRALNVPRKSAWSEYLLPFLRKVCGKEDVQASEVTPDQFARAMAAIRRRHQDAFKPTTEDETLSKTKTAAVDLVSHRLEVTKHEAANLLHTECLRISGGGVLIADHVKLAVDALLGEEEGFGDADQA